MDNEAKYLVALEKTAREVFGGPEVSAEESYYNVRLFIAKCALAGIVITFDERFKSCVDRELAYPIVGRDVVFLDIDGVMNSVSHWAKSGGFVEMYSAKAIDPNLVANLNMFLDSLNDPVVILSSSWRATVGLRTTEAYLVDVGFKYSLAGHTSKNPGLETRGEEIVDFMARDDMRDCGRFVILDDARDIDPEIASKSLGPVAHVVVDFNVGFDDAALRRATDLVKKLDTTMNLDSRDSPRNHENEEQ